MDSKQETPDQSGSAGVQMLVIPEGMMEDAVKAMEDLGLSKTFNGTTGTDCHLLGGASGWSCGDHDIALP